MLPLHYKIVLFIALWHEMTAQFQIGVDAAFLGTLFVFYGSWFARCFAVELAGMSQPLTAAFFTKGIQWVFLYYWLAPGIVRAQPVTIILAGVIAVVLAGVRCRQEFDHHGYRLGKDFFWDRSGAVVGALMGGLAAGFTTQRMCGSVLPLVGYGALLALPFSFGWMGGAKPEPRFDASFGDEDMFHDVGVSDEY